MLNRVTYDAMTQSCLFKSYQIIENRMQKNTAFLEVLYIFIEKWLKHLFSPQSEALDVYKIYLDILFLKKFNLTQNYPQ